MEPIGGHEVVCLNGSNCYGVFVGSVVPHHSHRLHRQQHREGLLNLAIQTGSVQFFNDDHVSLTKCFKFFVGDLAQASYGKAGAGTLSGYKEPAGPGVRVDACGYLGLTPPPQFDPMFAKVIGRSGASLAAAVARTAAALGEFHIAGLPTNLGQLRAILAEPSVAAGDARTTLLTERPEVCRIGVE